MADACLPAAANLSRGRLAPPCWVSFGVVLNQIYFCIGAAKTGTTILARMLDQQPNVACMWEAYFLRPRHSSSVLHPTSNASIKHGLRPERVQEWFDRATTPVERAGEEVDAIRVPEHLRSIVLDVLTEFGGLTDAAIVGDKWPYYYKSLGLMVEAFPDAKFVYNVRDPRAVWNSGQTFRNRGAGDVILAEMLEADDRVRRFFDKDRFVTLRYEDLIREPATTMVELAQFLGFEFSPEALDYRPELDALPNRWNWVPAAKGDLTTELTEKWRVEMTADEQAAVTERCADFIVRYGYD